MFLLNLLTIIAFVVVELGIPTVTGIMIDQGIIKQDMKLLTDMGLVLFGLAIFGGIGSVLSGYTSSRIANKNDDGYSKRYVYSFSGIIAF